MSGFGPAPGGAPGRARARLRGVARWPWRHPSWSRPAAAGVLTALDDRSGRTRPAPRGVRVALPGAVARGAVGVRRHRAELIPPRRPPRRPGQPSPRRRPAGGRGGEQEGTTPVSTRLYRHPESQVLDWVRANAGGPPAGGHRVPDSRPAGRRLVRRLHAGTMTARVAAVTSGGAARAGCRWWWRTRSRPGLRRCTPRAGRPTWTPRRVDRPVRRRAGLRRGRRRPGAGLGRPGRVPVRRVSARPLRLAWPGRDAS
ncbi:hypothetical protein SALBM311S_05273 [Streptomyces alboniger]